MNVGDRVFVSPVHSLSHGGKWGVINRIIATDLAPYKVRFHNRGKLFQFSRQELMSEQTYYDILSKCRYALSADRKKVKVLRPRSIDHIETDGGVYTIHQLLPITHCRSCNCDTTGLMTEFCEDCEYPLPSAY